ncbi:ABC transporter substrate-binding protein [Paenibacillus sp. strain BS8-2]
MKATSSLLPKPLKRLSWILMMALTITIIAGCGGQNGNQSNQNSGKQSATAGETTQPTTTPAEQPASTWTVEHELGSIEFSEVPKKIIVLDTYLLDIALALGIEPIGVAEESAGKQELPPYLEEHVNFELNWVGARSEPNLELMTALEPDLIIADLSRHQNSYEALEKIAPTLVVTGSGADDWKTIIAKMGQVIQQEDKAATVVAGFEQKLQDGKEKLAGNGIEVVAAVTLYPQSKVRVYTADSYTGAILHGLGFKLSHEADGKPYEELSVEALRDMTPNAYVLLQSPQYTADVKPEEYPVFGNLEVVKAGNSHTVGMEQWAFYRGPLAGEVIIREAIEIFAK